MRLLLQIKKVVSKINKGTIFALVLILITLIIIGDIFYQGLIVGN